MNNKQMKPQYKITDFKQDHGVDLEKLRLQLDKLHTIPQLKAGLDGKLSRVKEEVQETPEQREASEQAERVAALAGLAECVATAEGEWIDKQMKKIFRDDLIGTSYTRRLKLMKEGNIEPMKTLLSEHNITYEALGPPEGYERPEGMVLYRRLVIKRDGKIRAEKAWEWSRD